jgi:GDP-4-dehydro-6-deoxy-D-mannose reductase
MHLAGLTASGAADSMFAVNVQAAANVLGAAASLRPRPRVLIVGSAAMYGIVNGEGDVVNESHPLEGDTPYAVSKILQERWALLYARWESVPVIAVRPFNIIGPGQAESLVPATFLRQIADVVMGKSQEIRVGNLSAERDFVDVRDVAAAMWALMNSDAESDGQAFNIASQQGVRIADLLQACLDMAPRPIPVRQDAARLKRVEVPRIIGDASRLKRVTQWKCVIPWQQSVRDMWKAMTDVPGSSPSCA